MQSIDTASLRSSVEFQQGGPLPPVEELIELLNRLDKVREVEDSKSAAELTTQICTLVKPGVYEGYLGDDLQTSFVRANSTYAKGAGANVHTFRIDLDVLDCTGESISVDKERSREMELRDFLQKVNREKRTGGQHVGPRFWPF